MIGLYVPTRGRPDRFATMARSALATALHPEGVRIVAVFDRDDETAPRYPGGMDIVYVPAPAKARHSDLWNAAWRARNCDVAMMAADDLVFESRGWDAAILSAIEAVPDRIMVAWCDDGSPFGPIATHPFVSREWITAVGTFTPPYYDAWNADSWILDLGVKIGRLAYLDHLLIEHRHVDYGLAPDDDTYRRTAAYREANRIPLSDRPEWMEHETERVKQASRLLRAIAACGGDTLPTQTWVKYAPTYSSAGLRWG